VVGEAVADDAGADDDGLGYGVMLCHAANSCLISSHSLHPDVRSLQSSTISPLLYG
jgi:hypothetical protein